MKLESEVVIIINPHDGSNDGRYNHYSGIQNFYRKKCSDAIIRFDMQAQTSATLDQCFFANDVQNGEKITNTNSDGKATVFISNCVFKTYLNKDNLYTFSSSNCFENIDTNSLTLAHYTVKNICDAKFVTEAFGCQNNTCPDRNGCQTYGFDDEDVEYTEKIHPDISTTTPTPTKQFSSSFEFTFSFQFSDSIKFTKSVDFTKSDDFLPTLNLDHIDAFTKSNTFSKSDFFTVSYNFAQSFVIRNAPVGDSKKDNKLGGGAIEGIAVAAVALIAIIAVLIFFFIRKKNNIIDEDIETLDEQQASTNTDNPIYNKKAEDDPFQDDF